MRSACILTLLAILGITASGPAAFADANSDGKSRQDPGKGILSSDKLSPGLKDHIRRELHHEPALPELLIRVSTRAELAEAAKFSSRQAKGRFVHRQLVRHAQLSQRALRRYLRDQGIDYQSYYLGNYIVISTPTLELLRALVERPDVEMIYGNFKLANLAPLSPEQLTETEDLRSAGANIRQTGADEVWSEFSVLGEGIVIAGQDTGVDWDHPSLKNQYRGWDGAAVSHDYNWHDAVRRSISGGGNRCGRNSAAPCDDHGHGTHTLGTSIGDDSRGNQIGVAPGAKWIACRNMDNGVGRPSTYIECFQFFLAPWPRGGDPETDGDPDRGAHVINNSWGCDSGEGCTGDEFVDIMGSLKAAGIMVVVSAGNDGSSCGTINSGPAHNLDLVLAVGAHDHRDGSIASFSSRGPSRFSGGIGPHLSAPGVTIRSAVPGGNFASWMWSGTSMAGPHVAGAVALLWSADPSLIGQIDETIAVLTSTAKEKTTSQSCGGVSGRDVPNNTYGHGLLDILAAVRSR